MNGTEMMESSTALMTFLVQDLLDYAQIQANKFRHNFKKFDMREAVS